MGELGVIALLSITALFIGKKIAEFLIKYFAKKGLDCVFSFCKKKKHYNDYYAQSQKQYEYINSQQFRHMKINESLFSNTKMSVKQKSFETFVKDSDSHPRTLLKTLKSSSGNFVFIGEGGTGKTTSLLQIWDYWIKRRKELPLYIPLNEYQSNVFLNGYECKQGNFISTYVKAEYKLEINESAIPIILLLDGLNEVKYGNVDKVLSEIKYLIRTTRNIRMVLTSRYDLNLYDLYKFNVYDIQPLEGDVIRKFAKKEKLFFTDRMKESGVLSTPMMLSLYTNTCAIQKSEEGKHAFVFKDSESNGEIIYNYLLCQLVKFIPVSDQRENLYSAYITLFWIAPYIAWFMEEKDVFSINEGECKQLIEDYLSENREFIHNESIKFLKEIESKYECTWKKDDLMPLFKLNRVFCLLSRELSKGKDTQYSFIHQHFRDFLSALHIDNAIAKSLQREEGFVVPAEIDERMLPLYINEMLGGYYGEYKNLEASQHKTQLHALLDALRRNRKQGIIHNSKYTINNIIGIWKTARNNRIIGEDLTNLDLSHVPLNGIDMRASVFEGSTITATTLLPQGHASFINSLIYSKDGQRVLSASSDKTVKEWNRETGECLRTFKGHSCTVRSFVYSEDEKRILSAASDGTIKEWDRKTGDCLHTFKGHHWDVNHINSKRDHHLYHKDDLNGHYVRWRKSNTVINSVVYSEDEKRILSAASDGTLKEWNRETGECMRTFNGHSKEVNSAVYSKDEKRILSAASDGMIKEWDRETGDCLRTFKGHFKDESPHVSYKEVHIHDLYSSYGQQSYAHAAVVIVNSAVYSADEQRILSAASDKTIIEWDWKTKKPLRTFIGHTKGVNSAMYSSDGQRILSTSGDCTIKEWNRETGDCLRTFEGCYEDVESVKLVFTSSSSEGHQAGNLTVTTTVATSAVYSSDGKKILSTLGDRRIKEWDRETGQNLRIFEGYSKLIAKMRYDANGQRILFALNDYTIKEWDQEICKSLCTFEGHSGYVTSAMYSADGQKVLSASTDKTIKEWDQKTGDCLRTLKGHSKGVNSVMYSKDEQRMLSASTDKTIKEWDWETGDCLNTFRGHLSSVTAAIYSEDGQRILSVSDNGQLGRWTQETDECPSAYGGHSDVLESVASREDKRRRAISAAASKIKEWDRKSDKCLRTLKEHHYDIENIMYQADERTSSAGFVTSAIKEWDRKTGTCLCTFEERFDEIKNAIYSTDGKKIFSASGINTIKEWDRKKGTCLRIFEGRFIHMSNDGKRILSDSYKGSIKEWDQETGEYLRIFEGHSGVVTSAIYSADGNRVLSASTDNTIKEWNRETSECLHTFEGHSDIVTSAVYSANNKWILSASDDGTIKKWNQETGECLWTFPLYAGIYIVDCYFDNCKFSSENLEWIIRINGGKLT